MGSATASRFVARAPIEPLQKLLPELRAVGVPVIWVNWGNRPDLKNMPPNQLHLYKRTGVGIGLTVAVLVFCAVTALVR